MTVLVVVILASTLATALVVAICVAIRPDRVRPALRRTAQHHACAACGYDIEESLGVSARCPECGGVLALVGVVRPVQRRSVVMRSLILGLGFALLAGMLLLSGRAALALRAQRSAAEAAQVAAQSVSQARAQAAIATALSTAATTESIGADASPDGDAGAEESTDAPDVNDSE